MEEFKTSGLVPDVIDAAPPAVLKVQYGGKDLCPGDTKTPTEVKDTPIVTLDQDPSGYYTLVFHDPDAPSRADPKFGEFQHWLVMNITGNNINSGDVRTVYIGSGAPKGTADGRRSQKAREIANRFGLELVAGNFFLAEWDEYVPTLHTQLGFGK